MSKSSGTYQKTSSFIYRRLLGEDLDLDIRQYFFQGSFASFAISIISSIVAILIGFILAKLLGPGGYGAYTYIFSWVLLLSVIASFGVDDLSVREMARFQGEGDTRSNKGFLIWSSAVVFCLSLVVGILSSVVFNVIPPPGITGYEALFRIALVAIPAIAFLHLAQGHLRGLSQVIPGKLPEKIIKPVFLLIFVAIIYWSSGCLTTKQAIIGNTIAFLAAVLVSLLYLAKHTRHFFSSSESAGAPIFHSRLWIRSVPFFFMLSVIEIVNSRADVLMLGMLADKPSVGIYSVSARLVDLIPFALMVINPVLSPVISRLYFTHKTRKLEILYRKSARITFFLALPVFMLLAVSGSWILNWIGPAFSDGYYVLIILGTAQLFNAFTGAVGDMLLMTGFERETLVSYGVAVVVNILLNLWLIPIYGIYGAATATAISLFLCNLTLCVYVFKRIGISPIGLQKAERTDL